MALYGRIEVFDQCPSVERLTQEAGCSGFQCLRPDILLGESRDEDDRQPVSLRLQKSLQLDSAHAWHMNIRDHAGGVIQLGMIAKSRLQTQKYEQYIQASAQACASRRGRMHHHQ